MRFVTTCNKNNFDKYGYRLLEGWHHLPKDAELWWYVEGYDIPPTERVVQKDINQIAPLMAFKERHRNFIPPEFDTDVVRFSHKVYAAIDALMDYDGIGVWIDADCIPYRDLPDGLIEEMLVGEYIGCFRRKGAYTETGFWIVNCAHEFHKPFMDLWRRWYDQDAFKSLPGWTDCHTIDATIYRSKVQFTDLSGEFNTDQHPMAKSEIGKYIDHCKGDRKETGFSPENTYREVVCEP